MQDQGIQGRSSQRYQMQGLNQQGSRNDYRNVNIFQTHPNFPKEINLIEIQTLIGIIRICICHVL